VQAMEQRRQHNYKGDVGFETKHTNWFCVDCVL
jgi:hypothetical protein